MIKDNLSSFVAKINTSNWLNKPGLQALLKAIVDMGGEARVVGGAIRNSFLDIDVTDVDIATNLPPDVILLLNGKVAIGEVCFRTVPTGIGHGTVTVIINNEVYEVTTLRVDCETFGRNANVKYTDDWVLDAKRRDFTINALYCDEKGMIFDPINGFPDLQSRKVRFIGDPVARIKEDYLRILRFFRFSIFFVEGLPYKEGIEACRAEIKGLEGISKERIRIEFLKLFSGNRQNFIAVVNQLKDIGLLNIILNDCPINIFSLSKLIKLERSIKIITSPLCRILAMILGRSFSNSSSENLNQLILNIKFQLKLSNSEFKQLQTLVDIICYANETQYINYDFLSITKLIKVILYKYGNNHYYDKVLLLHLVLNIDEVDKKIILMLKDWNVPKFPISGNYIIKKGISSGEIVGEIIKKFEIWWIENDFTQENEVVINTVDRIILELTS